MKFIRIFLSVLFLLPTITLAHQPSDVYYDKQFNLHLPMEYKFCYRDKDCAVIEAGLCGGDFRGINRFYLWWTEGVISRTRATTFCSAKNPEYKEPEVRCVRSEYGKICAIVPDIDSCMTRDLDDNCVVKCVKMDRYGRCAKKCNEGNDCD